MVLAFWGKSFIFVVAHGPINKSGVKYSQFCEEAVASFNQALTRFLAAIPFWLVDANARLGSVTSDFIGTCEPEIENENGEMFRALLEEVHLYAANTYYGGGKSWTGSRGHRQRIDYILTDKARLDALKSCKLLHEIHLVDCDQDDHIAVAITLAIPSDGSSHLTKSKRCRVTLCPLKLKDEHLQRRLIDHMWNFRVDEAHVGIDEHVSLFEAHVGTALRWFSREK